MDYYYYCITTTTTVHKEGMGTGPIYWEDMYMRILTLTLSRSSPMQVRYATERKAIEASDKHFNGKLDNAMMMQLARKIIMNAEYVGKSDRANGMHAVSRIVWSTINNTMYAVVIDGKDISKGIATVISIYDVRNVEVKAERFGMKKVVK